MNQVVQASAKSAKLVSAATQENQQYLMFLLNGLTDVPMMPYCIRGVINLRGAVLPVLDLAVLEIPRNEIEPAPAFGAKIRTDFIEGMGKVSGHFVILLNVNEVLSVDEIDQLGVAAVAIDLVGT